MLSNKEKIDRFIKDNKLNDEICIKYKHVFMHYLNLKHDNKYEPVLVYDNGVIDIVFNIKEKKHPFFNNIIINHMPIDNYDLIFENVYSKEKIDITFQNFLANYIFHVFTNANYGFLLTGPIGCGKTYLMSAVANKFLRSGYKVAFVKVRQLIYDIKKSFNYYEDPIMFDLLNKCKKVEVLFLDDLGAESISEWSRDEVLFNILDYRMENNLLTCFTTNLTKDLLYDTYLSLNKEDENKVARLMERIDVLAKYAIWPKNTGSIRLKP